MRTRRLVLVLAAVLAACEPLAPVAPTAPAPVPRSLPPPSSPAGPFVEAPGLPGPPGFDTVVTNHIDTLFVQSAEDVPLGALGTVRGRIAFASPKTFNVLVGMDAGGCALNAARIERIDDDGTAGRGLVPADDFTAWMDGACTVIGWRVPGTNGRVYEFAVRVRGLEVGKPVKIRVGFEIAGESLEAFRTTLFSKVTVV